MAASEKSGDVKQRPCHFKLSGRLLLITLFIGAFFVSISGDFFEGTFVYLGSVLPFWKRDIPTPVVRKSVRFDEHVLLLVHHPNSSAIPDKSGIRCLYGNSTFTKLLDIEENWEARCAHPTREEKLKLMHVPVTLEVDGVPMRTRTRYPRKSNWLKLVYAAEVVEDGHLLLFAKGLIKHKKARRPGPKALQAMKCVFNGIVRTDVVSACQENFLCKMPPRHTWKKLHGKQVTLEFNFYRLHSIVIFQPFKSLVLPPTVAKPTHLVCACTMVWNSAEFLPEWVMYHVRMGVSRFFIYDNNSDDHLRAAVAALRDFNVTRHDWPWMKTQEAGFSHCAIRAKSECEWLIYIDVDEFVFPKRILDDKSIQSSTPLQTLLQWSQNQLKNSSLGNLKIMCQNYGPSGLTALPSSGQVVNYICREVRPRRYKSIVRLDAMDTLRCNLVHRFDLKPGYVVYHWRSVKVVTIKHYKYQVWSEFKKKFHRRVATYVNDWGLERSLNGRDRVSGLGTSAIEPSDWPSRFCEMNDTGARDYVLEHFMDKATGKLPWESM